MPRWRTFTSLEFGSSRCQTTPGPRLAPCFTPDMLMLSCQCLESSVPQPESDKKITFVDCSTLVAILWPKTKKWKNTNHMLVTHFKSKIISCIVLVYIEWVKIREEVLLNGLEAFCLWRLVLLLFSQNRRGICELRRVMDLVKWLHLRCMVMIVLTFVMSH